MADPTSPQVESGRDGLTERRVESIAKSLFNLELSRKPDTKAGWHNFVDQAALIIAADPATALLAESAEVMNECRSFFSAKYGEEDELTAKLSALLERIGSAG